MNVFLFPGQGSQYSGMYRNINKYSSELKKLFECAYDITGIDVKALCMEANNQQLMLTKNTQLAVLLMDLAYNLILNNRGIFPDLVMGHSLGEYAALVSCGALTVEDAIYIVYKRASLMANIERDGCLATIVGLSADKIQDVCTSFENDGIISIALFNTYKQIVIGGDSELVELATQKLKKLGAIKTIILPVSAAFHTSHMLEIQNELKRIINNCNFHIPKCEIILNCSAEMTNDVLKIKNDLILQCSQPVRWAESIEKIIGNKSLLICEVGPGKTLSGMIRSVNKNCHSYVSDNTQQLLQFITTVKNNYGKR